MQRDFIEPGGFGETLGNDVALLQAIVPACRRVLAGLARRRRPGGPHARGAPARPVRLPAGQAQPRQPEPAHRRRRARWAASWSPASRATRSSPRSRRIAGEIVIDKPGKGAFYATAAARACCSSAASRTWCSCGVTTEVCVQTTMREANDRGYDCLLLEDCTESYFPAVQGGDAGDDPRAGRASSAGRRTSAQLLAALGADQRSLHPWCRRPTRRPHAARRGADRRVHPLARRRGLRAAQARRRRIQAGAGRPLHRERDQRAAGRLAHAGAPGAVPAAAGRLRRSAVPQRLARAALRLRPVRAALRPAHGAGDHGRAAPVRRATAASTARLLDAAGRDLAGAGRRSAAPTRCRSRSGTRRSIARWSPPPAMPRWRACTAT